MKKIGLMERTADSSWLATLARRNDKSLGGWARPRETKMTPDA